MRVATIARRRFYLSRWRRWEVFVHYGFEDAQGIHNGGSEWLGLFFTKWGAMRVYRRQKVRPLAVRPQTVELLFVRRDSYMKDRIQSEVLK